MNPSGSAVLSPDWLSWPQTQRLVTAFAVHAGSLRFVGGAVRDTLLGLSVQDIDAATTLLPQQTMEVLSAHGIQAIPTGIVHGTVTALVDGRRFEITTLRRDIDCDGRHAEVEFTDNWQQDAARRDFTINALYLSPQGELFDYFGGVVDAQAGKVRFIGDAAQRIEEDRLRILRFFRFYARFGRGDADAAALAACRSAAPAMAALSGERVQKEMLLLLALPAAADVLALMQREAILPYALGFDVIDVGAFAKLAVLEQQTGDRLEPAMRLALFIRYSRLPQQQAAEALVERLRLSNAAAQQLRVFVAQSKHLVPQIDNAEQKKWLRALGKETFTNLIMLNWACLPKHADTDRAYSAMLALAQQWDIPLFPVTGQDLINSGMPPGKALGEKLAHLEALWESSGYQISKAELLSLAGKNE